MANVELSVGINAEGAAKGAKTIRRELDKTQDDIRTLSGSFERLEGRSGQSLSAMANNARGTSGSFQTMAAKLRQIDRAANDALPSARSDLDRLGDVARQAGADLGELDTPFKILKSSASDAARSVNRSLSRIGDRAERVRSRVGGLLSGAGGARALAGGALAGGAAVGGLGAFALSGVRDLQNLSDSINATTRETQELLIAFERFRLDSSDVSDAINTLTDRANDAENGLQSFRDDFSLVGLEVEDLRGKAPTELFRTFADAVSETEDANRRQTAAVRILGDEVGNRLLPLLQQGSEAFAEIGRQADENGRILSEQQVSSANDASVAISRLIGTIEDRGIEAFANYGDAIAETANEARRLVNEIGDEGLSGNVSKLSGLLFEISPQGAVLFEFGDDLNRAKNAFADGELLRGVEGLARATPLGQVFAGDLEEQTDNADELSRTLVDLNEGLATTEGQTDALNDALGPLADTQEQVNDAFSASTLITRENKQEEEERTITAFQLNETLKNSKATQEELSQANFEYTRSLQEVAGNLGPINDISGLLADAKEASEGLPDNVRETGNAFEQTFGGLTPRAQETTALLDESAILMAELSSETDDFGDTASDVTRRSKEAFDDFFFNILKDGELTFDRLADQLETTFLREISGNLTDSLFGGQGGGGFSFGGILDSVGNFFGGGGGGGEPSLGSAIADTRGGVETAVSSAVQSPGVIESITSSFSEGISGALSNVGPVGVAAVGSQIGGAALSAISEGRLGRRDFFEASAVTGAVTGTGFVGGALGGATTGVGFAEGIFGGQATQAGENLGALGGGVGNIIAPGIGSIVGGVVGSLVGGLEELKSAGIRLGIETGEIVGDFFRKVEEKEITGRNTVVRSAGEFTDEVSGTLNQTFATVKEAIDDFTGEFDSLNTAINRIDIDRTRLDLNDLDPQEQQKRIGQFFIKVLEDGINNAAANVDLDRGGGITDFFESILDQQPTATRAEEIRSQVGGIFRDDGEQRFETLEEALQGVEFATDVLTGKVFETQDATDQFTARLGQLESQFANTRAKAQEFGLETDKLRQNFIDFRGEIVETSNLTIRQLQQLRGQVQEGTVGSDQLRGDIDEAIRARQEEATRTGNRIIRDALGDLTTFDRVTRQLGGGLGADTRFRITEIAQSVTSSAASLREAQGDLNEIFAQGSINADTYKQSLQFLAEEFRQDTQAAEQRREELRQERERERRLEEQRRQQRLALNEEFSNRLLELEGNTLQARLNRFDNQAEEQLERARELGADVRLLETVQQRQRTQIIQEFEERRQAELERQAEERERLREQERQDEIRTIEQRLQEVRSRRDQILEAEREEAEERIENARDTRDAFRQAANDLRIFRQDLLTSGQSPLGPGEQFAVAERRFESVLGRAQQGDQGALQRLQGVSSTFLEQAQSQFGASARFADVFNRVQTGLRTTQTSAERQAQQAQRQIDLAQQQLSQVQQTNEQLGALNQQIATLSAELTELQQQNNEQNETLIDFQTTGGTVAGER